MSISHPRLRSPKLYFLHGFLGDPDDWKGVIAHLPDYCCEALKYPFQPPINGVLIGYSMGGRIASTSSLPKILISTHLGLQTEEERAARWEEDLQWMEKLKNQPLAAFLHHWYEQPLFRSLKSHPSFPQLMKRRMTQDSQRLIDQLKAHSLAFQIFQIPSQTVFLYGSLDQKYKALYEKYSVPSKEIAGVGHACHLEKPREVAQQIRQILQDIWSLPAS